MASIIVAKILGEMIVKGLAKKFGTSVFERWTQYRAKCFLEGFCNELEIEFQNKITNAQVDKALDEILANKKKSEALFDAYRSVSLSKSKKIGPRIIGLLTGKIIVEDREANFLEQDFFTAAEQLSDDELSELCAFLKQCVSDIQNKEKNTKEDRGFIEIELHKEAIDSNWRRSETINLAPIDLREYYGTWALKLKHIGLFTERIDEHSYDYDEDSERHIDEPGRMRELTWTLSFPKSLTELSDLVDRARKIEARD